MKEVEKRELFEQEQKIFEAGVQRADKRSGSFSFLTWPFFIAPLIACEEFLAAMFKPAAAEEEEDAEAAMMPIPAIITLTPQSTAVPSMRSQRFPPSEVVNCRVGQRSNPFSPAHRSSSARRSSAPPTCLETSAV